LESRIFLESTGIFTKNSTNMNIRKVHNDRFDSKKAALVGLKPDLKVSLMPSDLALNCRNLCREYYDLMDNRSAYVNKLQGELHMAFPQNLGIFSKVTTNTSLTLLETYTSPDAFIEADKQEIVDVIKSTARFGLTYANNKYHAIIQAAHEAQTFGYIIEADVSHPSTRKTAIASSLLCCGFVTLLNSDFEGKGINPLPGQNRARKAA